jgi:hypothetical protein
VLLDLQLARARPPCVSPGARSRFLTLEGFEGPAGLCNALLGRAELLRPHEHARPARRRPTGHRPARLVNVPFEGDTAHTNVPRERHRLRGLGVVADQRIVEHERDRLGDLIRIPDERKRWSHFARREVVRVLQFLCEGLRVATTRRGRGTHLGGELECTDLVQRDERHALPDAAAFEQVLAYALVLDHDVVQLPPRGDLERSALPVVLGFQREQRRHEALDLARIETRGRGIVEIKLRKPRAHRVTFLRVDNFSGRFSSKRVGHARAYTVSHPPSPYATPPR